MQRSEIGQSTHVDHRECGTKKFHFCCGSTPLICRRNHERWVMEWGGKGRLPGGYKRVVVERQRQIDCTSVLARKSACCVLPQVLERDNSLRPKTICKGAASSGADCRDTCRDPPPTSTLTRNPFLRLDSCFGPCRRFPDRMRGICPFARRQGLRLPCSQGGPLGAPPQVREPPTGCLGSCTLWLPRRMVDFPP
jgi:hypothetical protein